MFPPRRDYRREKNIGLVQESIKCAVAPQEACNARQRRLRRRQMRPFSCARNYRAPPRLICRHLMFSGRHETRLGEVQPICAKGQSVRFCPFAQRGHVLTFALLRSLPSAVYLHGKRAGKIRPSVWRSSRTSSLLSKGQPPDSRWGSHAEAL